MKLNVGKNRSLRIAAITLELRRHPGDSATCRDFQRVPDLTVENWAA